MRYFAVELVALLPIKLVALVPILVFTIPYSLWNLIGGSLLFWFRRDSTVIAMAVEAWAWRGNWRQFWLGPQYDIEKRLEEVS